MEEPTTVRDKMASRIQHMASNAIIRNRRYLDDEQLIRSEQLAVLDEIFNANVRDEELGELSSHFAGILRGDHPCHLAIWGKTGTGKTLTLTYFLNLLAEMAQARSVPVRHEHLDLSTPRPCFRALNDLACLFNASKRYKKGISLEELMLRIEAALAEFRGYLILFIDEVDNVRRDRDAFLTFLVRRLPQRIQAKLILVLVSNRLNWPDHLDPRVKSFLKLNELIFKPYDALDLQHILRIRVEKALHEGAVEPGVIEKIAALASQDHGDARQAVGMLGKSAYLAEKAGSKITLAIVDEAATELGRDRYLTLLRSAPVQLQAAMGAVIDAARRAKGMPVGTGEAYDAYKAFCDRTGLRMVTGRAFADLLAELDMYSLLRSRVLSRGRYGRTRELVLELSDDLIERMDLAIRMNFQAR
ncbi:MAG: AAA family ATPase [Tepidisphaeraceae bacterium]|jgi:cell division control protein 6